jgi:hypothetical protein
MQTSTALKAKMTHLVGVCSACQENARRHVLKQLVDVGVVTVAATSKRKPSYKWKCPTKINGMDTATPSKWTLARMRTQSL